MLTLEQLRGTAINECVAREAYAQTEKRLEDTLATKASHEQKAFALMAAYITAAIVLFSVSGVLHSGEQFSQQLIPAFLYSAVLYVVGAVVALIALWNQWYGAVGSDPEMWLEPGYIDGPDSVLPAMMAYITHHHHGRIRAGQASNRIKANLVRAVIVIGLVATANLGVWILWTI